MEQKNSAINRLRKIFPLLERLSPSAGAWISERLWFRVRRKPPGRRSRRRIKNVRSYDLHVRERDIPILEWPGQGAVVLLLHGWGGSALQMTYLGGHLAQHGFHVYAFDAPAHGLSPGRRTDVLEIAAALRQVVDALGGVDTLITHSYGGVAALYALSQDLPKPRRLVLLSPVARVEARNEEFCDLLRVGPKVRHAFQARLEKRFGADWWQRISPLNIAPGLDIAGLIVHDDRDRVVPSAEAEELHQAWSGSRLIQTSGLGHQRLLKSHKVVEHIVDFITG